MLSRQVSTEGFDAAVFFKVTCKWMFLSYRDIAVNNEQLLSGNVKLAAQLIRLPVDDPEPLVVRVENGLQKLQLGLQSRNRHLPLLISGDREGNKKKQRDSERQKKRRCAVQISAVFLSLKATSSRCFSACVFMDVNVEIKALILLIRLP